MPIYIWFGAFWALRNPCERFCGQAGKKGKKEKSLDTEQLERTEVERTGNKPPHRVLALASPRPTSIVRSFPEGCKSTQFPVVTQNGLPSNIIVIHHVTFFANLVDKRSAIDYIEIGRRKHGRANN